MPPAGQPVTSVLEHHQSATHSQSPAASTRSNSGPTDCSERSRFDDEREEITTTSDEVERLQKLIRSEFGIETQTSRNNQLDVRHRSNEVTTFHDAGANPEKNPPFEIDLTDFRHIADAACQHAIRTAKVNLRNRRLRGLLMSASLGCSIVCGLAAIFAVSNDGGRSLLVSMAIMSLLGYMLSCRTADETE